MTSETLFPGYVFDPEKKVIWRERRNLVGWQSPGDNLDERTPTIYLNGLVLTAEKLRVLAQFLDDIAEDAA